MPRPPLKKRGPKPVAGPEIHDLCLVKRTKDMMPLEDIAWFLFEEHGVCAPRPIPDPGVEEVPDRPVHRSSVCRWIYKAAKRMTKEQRLRAEIEAVVAGMELDELNKILFELRRKGWLKTNDDVFKFLDMALKIRQEKSKTFGVYVKRQEVDHRGGVELPSVDRRVVRAVLGEPPEPA